LKLGDFGREAGQFLPIQIIKAGSKSSKIPLSITIKHSVYYKNGYDLQSVSSKTLVSLLNR
jgi:hypothetical protein